MADASPFVWTDENKERAKRLWLGGSTASQIALDIGAPSRNAVIGKLKRMGVKRAEIIKIQNAKLGGKKTGGAKGAKPVRCAGSNRFAQKDGEPSPPILSAIRVVERSRGPTPLLIPLVYLSDHTCKWPIGTPGEEGGGFCGNRPAEGRPYCGFHCAKAYQPADNKKDAKALVRSLRRYVI